MKYDDLQDDKTRLVKLLLLDRDLTNSVCISNLRLEDLPRYNAVCYTVCPVS